MGDCLAVVNLVEASRMDYNFDVTELAINPTLLCFFLFFFFFFFGFWFLFFFFWFFEGTVALCFFASSRGSEILGIAEGSRGRRIFLFNVGWLGVWSRMLGIFRQVVGDEEFDTQVAAASQRVRPFFNLAVPFGFLWPPNGFHVGTNISKVFGFSVM